jgi:hypothetical protein
LDLAQRGQQNYSGELVAKRKFEAICKQASQADNCDVQLEDPVCKT